MTESECPVPAQAASPAGRVRLLSAGVLAVLLAVVAPTYGGVTENRAAAAVPSLAAPTASGQWSLAAVKPVGQRWQPDFNGHDADVFQTYSAGDATVDFYFAFYRQQREGAEVVSTKNSLVDDVIWKRAGSGNAAAMVDGVSVTADMTRILSRAHGRVVWSWYWVDDRYTANPYVAKLLELKVRLLGGNPAAGIFVIATDYVDTPREAVPVLEAFLASISPITVIGPALPSEGDGEPTLQANSAETEMDG